MVLQQVSTSFLEDTEAMIRAMQGKSKKKVRKKQEKSKEKAGKIEKIA